MDLTCVFSGEYIKLGGKLYGYTTTAELTILFYIGILVSDWKRWSSYCKGRIMQGGQAWCFLSARDIMGRRVGVFEYGIAL